MSKNIKINKINFPRIEKVLELYDAKNIKLVFTDTLDFTFGLKSIFSSTRLAYVAYDKSIKRFKILLSNIYCGTTYENLDNLKYQVQDCINFITMIEETAIQRMNPTPYKDKNGDIIYDNDVLEDEYGKQVQVYFDANPEFNRWEIDDEYGGYVYPLEENCKTHRIVYGQLKPVDV